MTAVVDNGFDDQDAVGIQLEGYYVFGFTFRSRGKTTNNKLTEQVVVFDIFILALVDLD